MTDRAVALIRLAVSMIVTAIVIITIVVFIRLGSEQAQESVLKVTQIITIDEARYGTDLEGTLTGATVRGLIAEYNDGGIYTLTTTAARPGGFYSSDGIDNPVSRNYVKDDTTFTGEAIKNENGVVIAVSFCQTGQPPATFNLASAESAASSSVENRLLKTQFDYYENVKEHLNACVNSVKAYSGYAKAVSDYETAMYHEIYRETTQEYTTAYNYSYLALLARQETEFYKELSNAITNVWKPNNWFEMLYMMYPDLDFGEEEPEEPEDPEITDEPAVPGEDDDDWGNGGIDTGDEYDGSDDDLLDDDFLGDYDWGDGDGGNVPIVPPTLDGGG